MQKETISIDVEKLQLLNERIGQTLEALNQLRLSARQFNGLSNGLNSQWNLGQPTFGSVYGQPMSYGQIPYGYNHGFIPQTIPYGYVPAHTAYGYTQMPAQSPVQWDARFSHIPFYGQTSFFGGVQQPVVDGVNCVRPGLRSDFEIIAERERLAREQAFNGQAHAVRW